MTEIEKDELNGKNDIIRMVFWDIILALMSGGIVYVLLNVFVGGIFRDWNWGIFIAISIVLYPLWVYGHYREIKKWHTCPKCKEPFALEVESYNTLTRKLYSKRGDWYATGKREFFFTCAKCGEHCSKTKSYSERV